MAPNVKPDPIGLYVHIPFCSVKCFYCDFTAFSGQRTSIQRYLKALRAEALSAPRLNLRTLYVGGGTPSELTTEELQEFFHLLEASFGPIGNFRESTFEANPESLDSDKLKFLAEAGINRLSLGLQTLEPRLLKLVGRRHTVEDFLRVYQAARGLGFSLNVDLMYALPTQTLPEAESSLDAVLRLRPDHLSLYGLQVEDRTLFGKREVEVDEDLAREMFEGSLDHLAQAGYRHYEISNFALPGRESIHNQIYWHNGDYLGLGCGASGYWNGIRYTNTERLADYCKSMECGDSPVVEREILQGKEKLGETVMLGLRLLEGIELTREIQITFRREIEKLIAQNWLELVKTASTSSCLRLTRSGVFLANRVFEAFVPPFLAQ